MLVFRAVEERNFMVQVAVALQPAALAALEAGRDVDDGLRPFFVLAMVRARATELD